MAERRRGRGCPTPLEKGSPLIHVIDFFSGCGGTSLGFRQAGMKIAAGIDCDADAARTYRRNFPEATFIERRIEDAEDDVADVIAAQPEGLLLFSGCAPCQPFSRIRRDGIQDRRRGLLDYFGGMIERFHPALVFVENVPGLEGRAVHTGPFQGFLRLLRQLGYHFDFRIVSSQEYGVPQYRRRLVVMASLFSTPPFPDPTHGPGAPSDTFSPAWEWIRRFPPLSAGEAHASIPNHRAARLSQLNLQRISATPPGGGRQDWPPELVLDCHKRMSGGYTDVYGRMHKDRPASALTTRCISLSNGRFGHPEQDRAISVREAAALQTFPNDFVFEGSFISGAKQVGNAVPVLLARRFGEAFVRHVRSRDSSG